MLISSELAKTWFLGVAEQGMEERHIVQFIERLENCPGLVRESQELDQSSLRCGALEIVGAAIALDALD